MDKLLAEEQVSPVPTWPDDLAYTQMFNTYLLGALYLYNLKVQKCWKIGVCTYVRVRIHLAESRMSQTLM